MIVLVIVLGIVLVAAARLVPHTVLVAAAKPALRTELAVVGENALLLQSDHCAVLPWQTSSPARDTRQLQ